MIASRNSPALRFSLVVALFASSGSAADQPKLIPYKASGIYDIGERAGWTVEATPGQAKSNGRYAFKLKKNNLDVVRSGSEIHGDSVNVAARLQTIAEPGQVVIGGATYDAVAGRVTATPLGDLEVKGRRQTVRAYAVENLV